MPASPAIPFAVRLKLLRQQFLSALNIKGNVPLRFSCDDEMTYVHFEGRKHAIPDVLRWKLYRNGWAKRSRELRDAYAPEQHFKLNREGVILDIGANTGDFALSVAADCKQVYCFEPDPGALKSLKLNLASTPNAQTVPKVVWKADENVSFGLETARADSSVFSDAAERVEVPGVTIDTFVRENGIERISLVKCDAEGAEPEVLQGAANSAHLIDGFAFDTGAEREGKCTDKACEELLRSLGYHAFTERAGGRQMTYGVRK